MPTTPDDLKGGIADADVLLLNDKGVDPVDVGEIRNNGGALKGKDAIGVFDLRTGGGISAADHEIIDSLVHELAETAYTEVTRTSGRVASVIVWQTAAKLIKVRETTISRSGGQVSVVVEKQYDGAGSLVQTLTSTLTRSSGQVASIASVET